MFDSHIHTVLSGDSELKLVDAIKRADELGIGMVLTEHMDINDYEESYCDVDLDKFYSEYSKFRGDKLLFGIELGLRKEAVERNIEIINQRDFDFILCSVHSPYDIENIYEFYDSERSKKEAYSLYFESMIKSIKENEYLDSLAHIDYIARYLKYDDKELYYHEHKTLIDEALKEIALRDKSMEISTKRIGNKKSAEELIKIYKRFRELGGKTVTIGSDSHHVDAIGNNFKLALEIAEMSGLKPVYYKNRKREYFSSI
ncbi:histidinol-phosphatase [Oceanirhabdus seepicola]|uniref:Histidinol-phosphatase n=1 Tax=Oceanirhabdus seepicola TaxID=2828781 RepID=A0A9J6P057_9CLOT|nr:histidinol-phosphatase [Oceanirhabdus seepicola]